MANQQPKTMEGPDSHGFPGAGMDLIQHEVRVNLFQVKRGKEFRLETLNFSGRMLIERGDPFINPDGFSQINFIVKSWVATAWSKALKQEFIYILSDDKEQPLSQIIAEKKGSDFPATIRFNVIFDARSNNQLIKRGHEGRPEGHNFMSIPPAQDGDQKLAPTITTFGDDDIIDMAVALVGNELKILPIEKADLKKPPKESPVLHLRVKPRDCNDKNGQTLVTFVDLEMPPGLPPEILGFMSEVPLPRDKRLINKNNK